MGWGDLLASSSQKQELPQGVSRPDRAREQPGDQPLLLGLQFSPLGLERRGRKASWRSLGERVLSAVLAPDLEVQLPPRVLWA